LARKTGKVCFTDVYEDTYGRGYMITCAAPFFKADGDFAGVVCMDMLIDDLYDVLVDFDMLPGDEDYAFLVDSSGAAVSTQFRDRQMNIITDKSINDEICINILNGVTDVSYNEVDSYYAYAPIKGVGWKLVLHVPQTYIQTPVDNISNKMIGSIMMYLFVFVTLSFVIYWVVKDFARGLTEPLYMLRQDAKVISSGDLDHEIKVVTNDEIGDLAVSFNHMAVSLKEYIANLTQVTAEKEKIGAELNVAAQIQSDMLPSIFPPFPEKKEFDLYATMDPAKEVGGDFYDFFFVDNDHLALVIADVSGKGIPAALFMMSAKIVINDRTMMGGTPAEILKYANNRICEKNEGGMFVTVWLGILDIKTGILICSNAGHEFPALCRNGKYELFKDEHGFVMGGYDDEEYTDYEIQLSPGDKIFVYTDGVPEATDAKGEMFNTDRMTESLNKHRDLSPEHLLKAVKEDVKEFVKDAPQFDDLTMLTLTFKGRTARKDGYNE
jgi:sigma-B regulation protein RsbU (phosphoserine phosphatase)